MKWLAEKLVRMRGWTIEGSKPDVPKAVIIGAPHTSNWDFVAFLALIHHFDIRMKFLIKDGLMVWPLSWFMKRWGAIPVERDSHHELTAEVVRAFDSHDEMLLALAPEGTRARADHWRSGFWRIAEAADVPVIMGFVDGKTKTIGLGPSSKVSGDPDAWMARAEAFYADKHGVRPENVGPIEL